MALPAVPKQQRDAAGTPVFFPVSQMKFTVLAVASFGIYELYWAYCNWRLERDRSGEPLQPFWRAFFAPLFMYSLLKRVRSAAQAHGLTVAWSPGLLAASYFVLFLTWRLPDPYSLISTFTFLPVLPVLRTIATLNAQEAPDADRNARFTGKNIALVVVGGLLFLLAVLGSFTPASREPGVEVRSTAA